MSTAATNNLKTDRDRFVGVYFSKDCISASVVQSNGHTVEYIEAKTYQTGEDPVQKQNALSQFVLDNKCQGVPCSFVLRTHDYILSLVDAPPVPSDELAQALRWSMADAINFPIEKAVIEAFEIPVFRVRDNVKLAYAVVSQKSVLDEIEHWVQGAGLELESIDIPELVFRDLISLYPDTAENLVGLFLIPEGGKLIVTRDNQIYIARKIELDFKNLVEKETKAGESSDKDILENLAIEIHRSQDYVNTNFRSMSKNSIVILPTILEVDLIKSSLKEFLGLEVDSLNLNTVLNFRTKLSLADQAKSLLAIGASLRHVGGSK